MTAAPVLVGGASPAPLTPRQLCALQIVAEFIDTRGYAPSIRDLVAEMDLSTTSQAARFVADLSRKGWIRRHTAMARGIEVLHRPLMPDFTAPELVPSDRQLPPALAAQLEEAARKYGPPAWRR